eukprot:1545271-Alexandrium_andersonii.AAC.1
MPSARGTSALPASVIRCCAAARSLSTRGHLAFSWSSVWTRRQAKTLWYVAAQLAKKAAAGSAERS